MKNRYRTAIGLVHRKDCVPNISAKGEYFSADTIVKIAKRFNIPVVEKPKLANVLKDLPEEHEIPEHLYHAVAVLLAEMERRR